MNAFCGELRFDGQATERQHAELMHTALACWHAQAVFAWQEGPCSLAAQGTGASPFAAFEVQPLVEPDLVLVGHVRLDDRQTLGKQLGLTELSSVPDSALLLQAWRRWGAACSDYLYGDWVCAIWDRRRQTLWLGRDAAGNTGLYYWQDSQRLVFGTSLKALLAHPLVPQRPALLHIARQLTVALDPDADGNTPYEGILRLPGGHALFCTAHATRLEAWWRPENLEEQAWDDEQACLAAFRDLYGAATQDRLASAEGPIALMLSAGLDSGTVAALAAPRLAARDERLLAFTAVPLHSPAGADRTRNGDESALAAAAAAHIGHTEFIPVTAAGSGLLQSIERMLEIHNQAVHGVANYHWIQPILQLARERGARVVLTGQGGNATVSWTGTGNLWPAVGRGDWHALASAVHDSHGGGWPVLKRQLLRPALHALQARIAAVRALDTSTWQLHSAIQLPFAQHSGLVQRMRELGASQHRGHATLPRDARIARFRLGRLGSAALGSLWMENGAAHQLEVRDPTRDRRLIEFCWQVPDRIFWAGGLQRGLIRTGMPRSLPGAILQARDKGLQAADLGHRVLAEAAQIEHMLQRLQGHALARECLDLARMRQVLVALRHEVNPATTAMAGNILLRGLAIGIFLLRF